MRKYESNFHWGRTKVFYGNGIFRGEGEAAAYLIPPDLSLYDLRTVTSD